jgi:DHA1 family bicyclomycin/chloramphenicol resistance-like MFS transporter
MTHDIKHNYQYTDLHKKLLITVLLLLLFVTQAATDIYVSGLPIMASEFNVSPAKMNMTITYYVYTQAFLFLIMGPVSDLLGRRKTILVSLGISTIATFMISESKDLEQIILLRIVQAIGSASVYIVSRLIIKEIYNKEEILSVTGLFLLGLVLSPALAPVTGAIIIKYLDWRWSFRFIGIVSIALTFIGFFIIKESNHAIEKFRQEFKPRKMLANYLSVLSNWLFIRYLVVVGGTSASFYAFISMSSYMYINEYHISSIYYSYLFTFIALGYLIGNKLMIYLSKNGKSGYQIVLIGVVIAFFVVILTTICIAFKNYTLLFIGLITLSGWLTRLATAFINPPIQVGVIQSFPALSSYAVGLLSSLQYVFAAFGSWVVGIMPFEPSTNIIATTIIFTGITIIMFSTIKHHELE